MRAGIATSPALPDLTWDAQLATIAANWAATCTDNDGNGLLDHNPNRGAGYPDSVGENIYASTGSVTPAAAVASWDAESANYDYAANTCGGQPFNVNNTWYLCGHYTQLVYRATLKVGCAIATCPSLTYSHVVVCDYSPAGNFYDSSTGDFYRPY